MYGVNSTRGAYLRAKERAKCVAMEHRTMAAGQQDEVADFPVQTIRVVETVDHQ